MPAPNSLSNHLIWAAALLCPPAAAQPAIEVFVLAGQSNMEGKAQNRLLEAQAAAEPTAELLAPYRKGNAWAIRDDVFVVFGDRAGKLTIGYGSPGRTGVELAFGTALGDHFDAPVLLVKTAWGGHSLARQFRPPSAGMPDAERLQEELERAIERTEKRNRDRDRDDPLPTLAEIAGAYGSSYRAMIAEVQRVLAEPESVHPSLAGRETSLAGFVWFQGWNDQYDNAHASYDANLRHLIGDVRRDLDAPGLPIVIAAMGQNGSTPATGTMRAIQRAQLAMNDVPEFKGTVRALATDALVDHAAEALYPEWKQRREEWDRTGSDHPYHYYGSAVWFCRIGNAMATAMLDLIEE